jgi:hypothetical protein
MSLAQNLPAGRIGVPAWISAALPLAAMLAASVLWHCALPLNHDVAWILEGANRLLDGGRFGRDVVDVNPPLAWWIALLPAGLARLTGMPQPFAATLFTAGLVTVALAISARLLADSPAATRRWVVLSAGFVLLITPGYDFGQREHLMAALAMPYLCAASQTRSAGSRWIRVAAGMLAAIGFCLKPYFFAIPIAVELWRLFRAGTPKSIIRPELLAMGAITIAYTLAVFLFVADYLAQVVPAARLGYGAYDAPFLSVVIQFAWQAVPILGAVLLLATRSKSIPRLAQVFLIAAAGAACAFLVQSKGWTYQLLPLLVFSGIAGAALFSSYPRGKDRVVTVTALAALALVVSLPALGQIEDVLAPEGTVARVRALSAVFRNDAGAGGYVYAFITSPRDIHPAVVESRVRWAGSECCVYLLPAAVRSGSPAAMAAAQAQLRAVFDGLRRHRPQVILVDDNAAKLGFGGARFDYLPYLQREPDFAEIWKSYRDAGRIGYFHAFSRR